MLNPINFIKNHQQKILIFSGGFLIAASSFLLGTAYASRQTAPEILVYEAFSYLNNTQNLTPAQSDPNPPPQAGKTGECSKIKGNISANGEKIYHMPGGSFYARTEAESCFDTEDQAKTAGFRKSSR